MVNICIKGNNLPELELLHLGISMGVTPRAVRTEN
jgi:hypothetical protein